MAVVITVAQQKGGAGKTTVAANLAAAWAPSRRVAILDIDPQRSLARWYSLRAAQPELPSMAFSDASGWRLSTELDRLRRTCDILLVDSPPQIDADARRAIRGADLVLVPLQPSPPDLWAADGTLALAAAEHRPVRLLLNRAPATSRLRTAVEGEIRRAELALLPAALGNRSAYAQAFAQGKGVTEAEPRSAAAAELRVLLAALEEIVS